MGTWLCSVVQGPLVTALTFDTLSKHRPSLLGEKEEERGAGGRGRRGGVTLRFVVFGFSLPHSLTPPIPSQHLHPSLPPSLTPALPPTHTHSTLCRSMTVSCGFSGPAVTCVLLIYRHYSRQANPEAPFLSRQPGSSPAEAYLPLCRVGPCQVIQLYQSLWKQQRISCTQPNSISCGCMSAYVTENAFKHQAPPPLSAPLLSVCPPSSPLHSMGHVMGTMSETP